MTCSTTMRLIAAGALFCSANLLSVTTAGAATFLVSDVTTWYGAEDGPNTSEAVLVIDWADGGQAWAWGFRWDSAESKTGQDMLAALLGAEPRLTVSGLASGFVSHFAWDADLNGTPERFKPGFDAGTGDYWTYSVNNAQQDGNFNNGAAPGGAHLLPPLGSPYDEAGQGAWISSNTGVNGRPLADGAWDGFYYAGFGSAGPGANVVSAPVAVPEPGAVSLFVVGALGFWTRRRNVAA